METPGFTVLFCVSSTESSTTVQGILGLSRAKIVFAEKHCGAAAGGCGGVFAALASHSAISRLYSCWLVSDPKTLK